MINCIREALNLVDTGIIILDTQYEIVFWNRKIERLSKIPSNIAIGENISDICTKFKEEKYRNILAAVLKTGQSRFCSSTIHKAFVYDENTKNFEQIRQNMYIEPILNHDKVEFLLIQITDKTDSIQNELKIKGLIDELKKSDKQNSILAKYDSLTGLYNRFSMEEELSRIIESYKISKKRFALLFIDLDGFKTVNDTYGHIVGDILLQQVSGRCQSNTKQNDIISRIGGDEFLIILLGDKSIEQFELTAKMLVDTMKRPYKIDNKIINISTSIGISIFPDHSDTVSGLIHKADFAMYRAKQEGKDGFRTYNNQYENELNNFTV